MNQELFDKVFGPSTWLQESDAKVRETISVELRPRERQANNSIVEQPNTVDIKVYGVFKKWSVNANEGKLTPEKVEEHHNDYEKELKWSMIRNKVVEDAGLKVSNDEIVDRTSSTKSWASSTCPHARRNARIDAAIRRHFLKQENGKTT
jgi:trigger factor